MYLDKNNFISDNQNSSSGSGIPTGAIQFPKGTLSGEHLMPFGIIYKATNLTGKNYIGKTEKTLAQRKGNHAYRAKKDDKRTPFQAALIDEGFSNFTWEQIDTAETPEELSQKEAYWTEFYHADNPAYGYNSRPGGDSGYHLSAETRKKLSMSNMGHTHTEEARKKIGAASAARPRSEETKRKTSAALMGHFVSEESREIMRIKAREIGVSRGEKNPNTNLTNETVRQIKIDLASGLRNKDAVKKYGVSLTVIECIKYGRTWKHIQIDMEAV